MTKKKVNHISKGNKNKVTPIAKVKKTSAEDI